MLILNDLRKRVSGALEWNSDVICQRPEIIDSYLMAATGDVTDQQETFLSEIQALEALRFLV